MFEPHIDSDYPDDYRWDKDKNAKVLNVVFQGGTFGHFLKFFLDKFSKQSNDITQTPFNDIGNSHNKSEIEYSGLIQRYHPSFINDNKNEKDLPVCLIMPTTKKHYLFLKKAQWFKAGDRRISPDDLWSKPIGDLRTILKDQVENIINLYDVKESVYYTWLPKFIVRDWYKLEFIQPFEQTYNFKWFESLKNQDFFKHQNTYILDLETFFNWDTFIMEIKKLDSHFQIEIDFDRIDEMRQIFNQGYALDQIRQDCNRVIDILDHKSDQPLHDLDVSLQAFIYAEIEKRHPGIVAPLTNRFFRDGQEIEQFVEHYPNWYRQKNPNLP